MALSVFEHWQGRFFVDHDSLNFPCGSQVHSVILVGLVDLYRYGELSM